MDPVKPAGESPVDLELGPIPEAAHSLRVGDAEYRDAWTAQQMHEERERCYALGVAAERERCAVQQGRFAGWFREIPSAMSYRLWQQGGHEQGPDDVALYEA